MSRLLDVDAAAELLGVSRYLIYKMVARKQLPCFRVSTCIRFSPEQLQTYLQEHSFRPESEPALADR